MRGNLKIHSENILPIIKKWLYSEKDIFVRELVSNATDAMTKLKALSQKEITGRIDIKIDAEKRTLTFSDTGIGMDAQEVETYIAQIAFSGAEEFVKKYEKSQESEQIIGHFGLGFYSAYMVAEKVEIQTLSYKENSEAVYWSCDGSSTYFMEKGERKSPGTDVILTISKEEEEYLDAAKIRTILLRNCRYLPFPIYLNDSLINDKLPLWVKAPSDCTEKEYLDFYHDLFPLEEDPLFWIHLNVDFPFHLKGILYFPKLSQEKDLKKEAIQLYCNRVFVSDNCKDLLPDYLMILKGAIDSPDIPLNVSRSYLQVDKTVRQLSAHISKKITDRLFYLYQSEKEKFLSYWNDIELIIKFGILHDEKFYERAKTFLVWQTHKGEWLTVEDYLEIYPNEPILYTDEEKTPFLDLYKQQERPILVIKHSMINHALLQYLEKHTKAKFKRIDAHLDEKILDPSKEKSLLDQDGKSEAFRIAAFFQKKLEQEELEVEAKSLATSTLPAFIMIKEEERRLRDSLAFHQRQSLPKKGWIKPTLVVNTNSKLINAVFAVDQKDPELAKEMVHEVLDLARLSQKEMEPEALSTFISRSNEILEKLVLKII